MKTKILFLLLFLCELSTYAQKNNAIFRFGNGGGFTEISTVYLMNEKGEIFKEQKDGNAVLLTTISSKKLTKYKKNAKKLELANYSLSSPGNIYFFITYNCNTLSWGDNAISAPDKIISFYKCLLNEVVPKK